MEIDLGLAAAVLISSGAGWYAGHRFERKRALEAIYRIRQQVVRSSVISSSRMMKAAFNAHMADKPEGTQADADAFMKKLVESANADGADLRILSDEQAAQMGLLVKSDGTPDSPPK